MICYPKSVPENEALKQWLATRIPEYRPGSSTVCVGVEREGKLAAVIAWDNWRGQDVELTFAADNPRWATRQTVSSLLAYAFLQLGCTRVTSFIRRSNARARKLVKGVGFVHEGTHRHAGKNLEAMLSYGMTRKDYVERYVKRKLWAPKDNQHPHPHQIPAQ